MLRRLIVGAALAASILAPATANAAANDAPGLRLANAVAQAETGKNATRVGVACVYNENRCSVTIVRRGGGVEVYQLRTRIYRSFVCRNRSTPAPSLRGIVRYDATRCMSFRAVGGIA